MGAEGPPGERPAPPRRRQGCRRVRLLCMLALTFLFFVVEVVVSRLTESLAMLSDSFHMLSDVMALVVALVAVRFAQRTRATKKNTFGWVRAEVMGALVNAVFLTALCFTILLEAIERFTEPHEIQQPWVVIGVGVGGLLINVLGLCLFHQHGGHGHSHGGSRRSRSGSRSKALERPPGDLHKEEETNTLVDNFSSSNGVSMEKLGDVVKESPMELQPNGNISNHSSLDMEVEEDTSGQLNMRGVFLHVLGDALGSVIVVVNALVFYSFWTPCPRDGPCINPCKDDHCGENVTQLSGRMNATEFEKIPVAGPCWVLYLDPALCLIMVCILLYTTYPLLKESALILLQTVPKQIDIRSLNEKLRKLEEVEAVHELHVWQLAGSRIIGTAHIKCKDPESYMKVAKDIKEIFHDEGIHATTIQPEFTVRGYDVGSDEGVSKCELPCRTQCALKQCCGAVEKTIAKKTDKSPSISISCSEIVIDSPHHKTRRTKSECIPAIKLEAEPDPNKQFESSL
ncbi:Zinc transporter 1 [Varanus komodoensis]|uniref:Solute carrier family 30 member 1 n=3 Tax=Varanus TaxID=8556 RepID=A0A8D2LXH1_VARKO|nr:zinc transporter 1 [Varanus komodoensis]KAF7252610.1 Zinc transporter 1 [Varanus komodoensis]